MTPYGIWHRSYCILFCQASFLIGPMVMSRRILWIKVFLLVLPSFDSSVWKVSWNWLISFFLNFGIEAPFGFVHDSRIFWKKNLPPKWAENRIFWIYEKIWSLIFSEFGLSWNLCFLLCSCPNSISEKNLVLEI